MMQYNTAIQAHNACSVEDSGGSTLGPGGTGPPNLTLTLTLTLILPSPKFLDTVVLLLVELIGSIVNFA